MACCGMLQQVDNNRVEKQTCMYLIRKASLWRDDCYKMLSLPVARWPVTSALVCLRPTYNFRPQSSALSVIFIALSKIIKKMWEFVILTLIACFCRCSDTWQSSCSGCSRCSCCLSVSHGWCYRSSSCSWVSLKKIRVTWQTGCFTQ